MKNVNEILEKMSLEDKTLLVSGHDFMYTNELSELGINSIRMSDGPHGLRVQNYSSDNGVTASEPATAFPTASLSACSFDPDLLYQMGQAMAEEALYYGVDVILGPGCNIKRNPCAGRNFEYFSEDPLLSGMMAGAEIKGIQSLGVGSSLKHFALNNAENFRFMGDSICDERAMREIYLKSFEIAIKEGKPETVMCSYNKINGTYSCQNSWLLNDVLRKEWGFDGLVMTDWGATHDRVKMIQSGLDLEMPGDTPICRKWIMDGVNDGSLSIDDLDSACRNVMNLALRHSDKKKTVVDFDKHDQLAEEIALNSAVLLKNDGILPLDKKSKFLVLGELFEKMRYQGSGSSMINPYHLTTPKMAFDNHEANYIYRVGYKENETDVDESLLADSLKDIDDYDTILVFLGLTDYVESEGADRENMTLPKNQLALVDKIVSLKKKIVVIYYGGSSVEMPFKDSVSAILNMYLPGQRGGEATRKLLFGEKNPCGKLAETWVEKYQDVPYGENFSKNEIEVYKESIYVGYRYYSSFDAKVSFPFGFGLSYTTFSYSNMSVYETDDEVKISFDVTNTGCLSGADVPQVYVHLKDSAVYRPQRELKGFSKVYLEPGETKSVEIVIRKEILSYYDVKEKRYVLEDAIYEFELCSDSLTIKEKKSLHIQGEKLASPYDSKIYEKYRFHPESISDQEFELMSRIQIPKQRKKKPIHLESRFSDLQETLIGRILFNAVLSVAKKDMKKAKKLPPSSERDNKMKGAMFLKRILESNSIITMSMSAGKSCPYNFALGFVDLANGHIIKGIRDLTHPITISENKGENRK